MTGESPRTVSGQMPMKEYTPQEFALLKKLGIQPKITGSEPQPIPPVNTSPRQQPRSVFEAQQPQVSKPDISAEAIASALSLIAQGKFSTPETPPAPSPESGSQQTSEQQGKKIDKEPRKKLHIKLSRRAIGAIVAGTLVVGGGGWALQSGTLNGLFSDEGESGTPPVTSDLGTGVNIEELEPLGMTALDDTECYLPGAVLMILTVEGKAALKPVLPGTSEDDPYMTEEAQRAAGASEESIKQLSPYFTEDYNYATLENLPLYVNACSIKPEAVKELSDGSYEITRSFIEVHLKAPNELFGVNNLMWTLPQEGGADVETDPELGQYMTVPMSMYIAPREGDKKFNKAAETLNNSMKDPLQLALILEAMKADAVRQIKSTVDGQDNIHYPEGISEFQKGLDEALKVRLEIPEDANITWLGNYPIEAYVARYGGKPITDTHSLVGLKVDSFEIENVNVKFGTPTEPKPPAPPTPEPTPKPTQEAIND